MNITMVIIRQKIEIAHPMYDTMESAVDSDAEDCSGIKLSMTKSSLIFSS